VTIAVLNVDCTVFLAKVVALGENFFKHGLLMRPSLEFTLFSRSKPGIKNLIETKWKKAVQRKMLVLHLSQP